MSVVCFKKAQPNLNQGVKKDQAQPQPQLGSMFSEPNANEVYFAASPNPDGTLSTDGPENLKLCRNLDLDLNFYRLRSGFQKWLTLGQMN